MADTLQSQLRVTAWPGTSLPLPDVLRVKSTLDLENGVILPRGREPYGILLEPVAKKLTGETYLHLAAVELDDPHSIFNFVSRYGTLGGDRAYRALLSDDPFFEQQYREGWERDPFFELGYRSQLDLESEWMKKVRAVFREAKRVSPEWVSQWEDAVGKNPMSMVGARPAEISPYLETLEEFRFAARCLRDLSTAWRMFKEGLDVNEVTWTSESFGGKFGTIFQPVHLLDSMLARFLRYFSPRLSWQQAGGARIGRPTRLPPLKAEMEREPTRVPLFAVCALELFNHTVDDAEYHLCANERCQKKIFVHQEGRAKKGQHRSHGVLYCSDSCARATAQREYRRRQVTRDRAKNAEAS